jgi:hypothetical protein
MEILDPNLKIDTTLLIQPDKAGIKKMNSLFKDSTFLKTTKYMLNYWTYEDFVFQDIMLKENNNATSIYDSDSLQTFLQFYFYSFCSEKGLNQDILLKHLTYSLAIETRSKYKSEIKNIAFSKDSEHFIKKTTALIKLISPNSTIDKLMNKLIIDLKNGKLPLG